MSAFEEIRIDCELVLESALHIGGEPRLGGAAAALVDRTGQPYIPGSSLAGGFFRDLAAVCPTWDTKQALRLSGRLLPDTQEDFEASCLRFRSAYPNGNAPLQVRDRVCIDARTRTAKEGAKFAYQEVAPGTRFNTSITIERWRWPGDPSKLEQAVAAVLALWRDSGGQIGGHTGAGNGWFFVERIRRDGEAWDAANQVPPHALQGDFYIEVDEQDPLLVGASSDKAILGPADRSFAITNWADGEDAKFIPGSSLRGVQRALLSRLRWESSHFKELFGTVEGQEKRAGRLKIRDAFPLPKQPLRVGIVERHAEDEFTRGVYESAKFNDEMVFEGTFQSRFVVLAPKQEDVTALACIFAWGTQKQLPLGAGQCAVRWELAPKTLRAPADLNLHSLREGRS